MVSKAGLSNPTRRSSASMTAATCRSIIPAKAFGIIHLAASESLPPASRHHLPVPIRPSKFVIARPALPCPPALHTRRHRRERVFRS